MGHRAGLQACTLLLQQRGELAIASAGQSDCMLTGCTERPKLAKQAGRMQHQASSACWAVDTCRDAASQGLPYGLCWHPILVIL